MEEQEDWRAHADFMNRLVDEGFMLLGGPLTARAMFCSSCARPTRPRSRRDWRQDCWTVQGLLRTRQISPWWLRLGSLGGP